MQNIEDEEILEELRETVIELGYDTLTEKEIFLLWNKKKQIFEDRLSKIICRVGDLGEEYVNLYLEIFKNEHAILCKSFRDYYSKNVIQRIRILGQSTVYALNSYKLIHTALHMRQFALILIKKQMADFDNLVQPLSYIMGVSGKKINLLGVSNYY